MGEELDVLLLLEENDKWILKKFLNIKFNFYWIKNSKYSFVLCDNDQINQNFYKKKNKFMCFQ